ncbi:MAG: hypothetical protein HY203_01835 [Nitrospirae bacterium]|nr:hypothetical protein [Nitrospirota bacterium]
MLLTLTAIIGGCRSNSDFVVINIWYNVALYQVDRWKGAEHILLHKVGNNQFKDEYFQFDVDNTLSGDFIFKIMAQDSNGVFPFFDRAPYIIHWVGITSQNPNYDWYDIKDNKFMFVPNEEVAPHKFEGAWGQAKTIISKAQKFKGTDVVLVLSHNGFEYQFKYKVTDVSTKIEG